jgi:hypothetical protein
MNNDTPMKMPNATTIAAIEEARQIIAQHKDRDIELDERSIGILIAVSRGLNGQASADHVASRMKYRPARSGRLAVTGTLRKLERDGFVGRIPPRDQWSTATWFLMPKGKEILKELRAEPEPSPGPKML